MWIQATGLLAGLGLLIYAWGRASGEFQGGSLPGLLLGVAGSACMLLAGLLPARKRAPARQSARPAQTWLRAHLWFGLLSGPLILMHAGFRIGGTLERALMAVFAIVYFSGLVGAALQHFLPRMMTTLAPRQAPADQLEVNCERLVLHGDRQVAARCGSLLELVAEGRSTASPGAEALLRSYCEHIRPFLSFHHPPDQRAAIRRLTNTHAAQQFFEEQRMAAPAELHDLLEELESMCDERRDMRLQQRLHAWLHGWLLIHVPLSLALLVLGVAHAVASLRYLY